MVLDGKSSQEYPVNAGVPQGSISKALLMTHLPADVICNIGVYVDKTTLYSKCDQVSTLATTSDGYWTWIWPARHCEQG